MLLRETTVLQSAPLELARQFVSLSLKDVDIGFAGRQHERARVHRAIAALRAGDPLTLRIEGDKRELWSGDGVCVGRLSRAFEMREGMRCIEAKVAAIVVWTRAWSQSEYAASLKLDRWEVVVPELVLAPTMASPAPL